MKSKFKVSFTLKSDEPECEDYVAILKSLNFNKIKKQSNKMEEEDSSIMKVFFYLSIYGSEESE